ncbi:late competence protein ComER [Anaerobacillus sp. MEB173]|uniref:late competence protein ComER n=1 Tax=Anaerobacillus sp. MEB173 TaxID=3383345 RepID=UPI003F921E5F
MKVGIIGTGSMGSIMISAFIDSLAVAPSKLYITNRTLDKAKQLQKEFPNIHVMESPQEVVQNTDTIFLCVKPLQMYPLLQELVSELSNNQMIISITSPISVEQLEKVVQCKVARAIPSITNRALAGSSLLTFGKRCNKEDQKKLTDLMEHISTPLQIKENVTRVSSDIASCGPAFFSFLIRNFIESAVQETEISKEEATLLATEMIIGLGKLLEKGVFTLPTLQKRVHVPGGVTGEGLKVLEAELGDIFNHLFQQTHAKFREDKEKVYKQYGE